MPERDVATIIARIIDAFAHKPEAEQEQRERHQKQTIFWTKLTLWALIVYSTITAFIFLANYQSNEINREAMIAANRAWLGISRLEIARPIEAQDGPVIMAYIENIGRYPAFDMKTSGGWRTIRLAQPFKTAQAFPEIDSWAALDNSIRSGCLSNQPINGGMIQFPSTTHEGHYQLDSPNPIIGLQDVRMDSAIILAEGCLTYRTFAATRHTGFCQYISKFRTGQWEFNYCPAGNFAE